jgi:hypothetical protein
LLRVLREMWRQSFGSDFVFWAAGARPKVLRGRHISQSIKNKKTNHTRVGPLGYKNSANPFLSAVFFRLSLLHWSPAGVLCSAGGPIPLVASSDNLTPHVYMPSQSPTQRPKPVRYVQYEYHETTARSETRKLARVGVGVGPPRCPAWGLGGMALNVVKIGT